MPNARPVFWVSADARKKLTHFPLAGGGDRTWLRGALGGRCMGFDHQFRSAQKNLDPKIEEAMAQTIVFALGVGRVGADLIKTEQGNMIGADIPDTHAQFVFNFLHQPVVIHDPQFGHAAEAPGRRPQSDTVMKTFREFGRRHVVVA